LDYLAWRKRVVEYLLAWLGPKLASVVEHLDERHPHVHALIVPRLAADRQLDLSWHPGYAARKQAQRDGLSHAEQEKAYRRGLRDCLDQYYAAVSAYSGHARVGARRTRLRRREALAQKALEDALLRAHRQARSALEAANAHMGATRSLTMETTAALGVLEAGFAKAVAMLHHDGQESMWRSGATDAVPHQGLVRASGHSALADLVAPQAIDPARGEIPADDNEPWPDDVEAFDTDLEDDPDPEFDPGDLGDDDVPDFEDYPADDPSEESDSDPV
jgi:hypothetical protein